MLQHDLLERLLSPRRLRSQPRVVKRKMSNYRLKRADHYGWPQPTRAGTRAVRLHTAGQHLHPGSRQTVDEARPLAQSRADHARTAASFWPRESAPAPCYR